MQIDLNNNTRGFDHPPSAPISRESHPYDSGAGPLSRSLHDIMDGFRRSGPGANGSFPSNPEEQSEEPHASGPRMYADLFVSGEIGGRTTSVTIVSGPDYGSRGGHHMRHPEVVTFQQYAHFIPQRQASRRLWLTTTTIIVGSNQLTRVFSNIIRDAGPLGEGNQDGEGGSSPGFARGLHDILSLMSPENAMLDDAVYCQEALDRIITGLMEANPQSNAAPPATEEALRNLERKPVDKEMLGSEGKAECTICIDEVKEGEMAALLPCKHWFHE
ncbi:hypothetical protein FSARC_11713 [Fusarium sarcochroum]|uniref:RING-type domain-containing protein n=1 Tax=Fusarium sarcochroum TaxID=1208366 RepID=A0A8H4TDS9_9HYPO|nr:hypothetical protein FSARC_11713 [Fusarium sarcochroum]